MASGHIAGGGGLGDQMAGAQLCERPLFLNGGTGSPAPAMGVVSFVLIRSGLPPPAALPGRPFALEPLPGRRGERGEERSLEAPQ